MDNVLQRDLDKFKLSSDEQESFFSGTYVPIRDAIALDDEKMSKGSRLPTIWEGVDPAEIDR